MQHLDLGGQADKTIDIGGRKVIIQITKDFIKIVEPTDNFEIVAKGIDPETQKRNNFKAVRKYNILLQINGIENQIPESAVKWEEEYDDTALGINCNHVSSNTIALIDPVQAWRDEAIISTNGFIANKKAEVIKINDELVKAFNPKTKSKTKAKVYTDDSYSSLKLNGIIKNKVKKKTKAKVLSNAKSKTCKLNRRGHR